MISPIFNTRQFIYDETDATFRAITSNLRSIFQYNYGIELDLKLLKEFWLESEVTGTCFKFYLKEIINLLDFEVNYIYFPSDLTLVDRLHIQLRVIITEDV